MFSFPTARTTRTASLALAATAVTAALSLTVVTGGFASAAPAAPAPTPAVAVALPSVSGSPEAAFTRIADFYGAYIDAVYDGDGKTSTQLRSFYLSKSLQGQLSKWEAANHADGVLRAQNVPLQWKVTSTGSGTGRTGATVTLTWGGGDTTQVQVQADLATRKIVSIEG
ncbi:hypothetical protein OG389_34340 [Streptomyces sp. NBC_00435]|uniref:hypothetical protein n=1 Tax=Streptomyces sp. NBC_00435 TaxID=2903649 RepID=UPI002E1ED81A